MLHEISNDMLLNGTGNSKYPTNERYKKLEISFNHCMGGIWLYPPTEKWQEMLQIMQQEIWRMYDVSSINPLLIFKEEMPHLVQW